MQKLLQEHLKKGLSLRTPIGTLRKPMKIYGILSNLDTSDNYGTNCPALATLAAKNS